MLRRVALVTIDVSEERTANVVPSLPVLLTVMMKGMRSSETSVISTTRRHNPEDGILYSHRRENLKSYIALTGPALLRRRNVSPVAGFLYPRRRHSS
jgi:hypothetical protein